MRNLAEWGKPPGLPVRHSCRVCLCTLLLLCAVVMTALPSSAAVHYVTVAGLGGEPDYEQRFTTLAKDLDKILKGSGGDAKVHTLMGAESTRAKITDVMTQVAKEVKSDDAFVLTLIGHGSYDGRDYKFNLKGPDVSGIELAALCDRIPATRQLIVNTTSASHGSLPALQKPNRALIFSTKSGSERNATVFGRYWVEALRDTATDSDKNETISALEAFRYADQKTTGFYETQKRLATEHAVLEDTGQGDAVRAPSTENGQGKVASQFPLLRIGSAQRAAADPAKRQLLDKKEQLEQQIDRLKYEKAALATDDYRKKLSALLVDLAQVQEELDK